MMPRMAKRITKVYTRTGDDGSTGICDNVRLQKDDPLIAAMGEVDELNSELGVVVAFSEDAAINAALYAIQHDLFNIGGVFAYPAFDGFDALRVADLEGFIDSYNAELEPLEEFILPGGAQAAALAMQARAVCRRVERSLIALGHYYQAEQPDYEHVSEQQLAGINRYINRLSDLLFVMARVFNKRAGESEVFWAHHKPGAR